MSESMRPGGGGRFKQFKRKLEGEGYSDESAGAIAASKGREKYGKKRFAEMGQHGKRRHKRSRSRG